MGKKKKIFKKQRKKVINLDNSFSYGPINITRFRNINVLRSKINHEQFCKMQNTFVDRFPIVCNELNDKIFSIVKEVSQFEPTEILKRAYWDMLAGHINLMSEVDITHDESISLRMLEYLQSIIASVPFESGKFNELTEEKWNSIRSMVDALFDQLNVEYFICQTAYNRTKNPEYSIDFEEYYYKAQMYWCNVRGDRYMYHEKKHLQDLLFPHSDILRELFGINAKELIDEIIKIQYALTEGMINTTREFQKFQKLTTEALELKIGNKKKLAKNDLSELMADVIKENDWEVWQKNLLGRFLGLDLFDLQQVTSLPTEFLKEFSWKQGEDIDFFSDGDYKGWPLRVLPVFKRPFIKLSGHYYCFDLYNLLDNFYRVLQKTICRIKVDYQIEWNEKQKVISEQLPFKCFEKLLPNSKNYKSVYYRWYPKNDSSNKEWCETDGIILYDDYLFVVEIKAGAFTYTSPANDFPSYINSLKSLLFKPSEQGRRFLEYLGSGKKVDLYDSDYKKVGEIAKDDFKYKHICVVTLDAFTELASQSQHLKNIGVDVGELPVWSISINDLRVYSDIFDNPLIFLHFIKHRMYAFQSSFVKTEDELDHLGLYLKHTNYVQYVEGLQRANTVIFHGYRSDIDRFFAEKLYDPDILCSLNQDIPFPLKEILVFLAVSKLSGRRRVASILLDYSRTLRNKVSSGVKEVLIKQQNARHSIPLSINGEIKISLFNWQVGIVDRDKKFSLEYAQAEMLISDDKERLILEVFLNEFGVVYEVFFQFLKRESLSGDELVRIENIAQKKRNQRIESAIKKSGEIGRNDACPCGSGKKFKKCCLP